MASLDDIESFHYIENIDQRKDFTYRWIGPDGKTGTNKLRLNSLEQFISILKKWNEEEIGFTYEQVSDF
jgi:hypothetical protein